MGASAYGKLTVLCVRALCLARACEGTEADAWFSVRGLVRGSAKSVGRRVAALCPCRVYLCMADELKWTGASTLPPVQRLYRSAAWEVVALPDATTRRRVAIHDIPGKRYAAVWRDCWREAFNAARAGERIPAHCRAPSFG